ncbi:MAG: putative porin [Saprospiraceae bacterium]
MAVNHFWVSHRLKVWKMHLDNRISYQSSNNDRIRFPEWVTRHRLYYDDLWFKKTLRTQIGLEARLISPWRPYGYQPVSGVFYLQSKRRNRTGFLRSG